ncbi:hypothetical protein L249_5664 [Ophiocordyceps polyrhachis-furcata BCC 54312]|uniref:Mmc1 C-terminal domain-containing protein n=1 Tax=Ophiocordyceps polyrhachis-furcata BCC 54312 TaxID=1330021 RepID=A0A367L031_9HYPO|nr:hypothetical protein L249_5664 [Ophiocordyceps polyrhachis-furcata BCC 54312]
MACRPGLPAQGSRLLLGLRRRPICPLCSLVSARPRRRSVSVARRSSEPSPRRRRMSTATPPSLNPRAELENALVELQRRFPGLTSLPRLQLALQGLRHSPGHEPIRIAVLGLATASSAETAKTLLGALLADPLVDEAPWEKDLVAHDAQKPLLVRVGPDTTPLRVSSDAAPRQLHVSSPALDGLDVEFLLMPMLAPRRPASLTGVEDGVLVPVVDNPCPVHQALVVADGLSGAVAVASLPLSETSDGVKAAVDMPGVPEQQRLDAPGVVMVDASLAAEAIRLFRQGPHNAMQYERLWYASNLPALTTWLKAGIATADGGATKPAVRRLIASLLQRAVSSIRANEQVYVTMPALDDELNDRLARWAQEAHSELRDQTELAFAGRRWRQLGWWKLFWRVDDVAMLTNEMLSQRFLPTAEQELIYLAGRIAQTRKSNDLPPYPQPTSSAPSPSIQPQWPGHITFTRRYLQHETVPALQALAQRLVVQSLGTSGATTSLAALLYVSSLASTLYEAGAVAALGIVYSLGRLQKKWDAARTFWEGEVREEGRKAVRGAEESVVAALGGGGLRVKEKEAMDKARELIATAEDALVRMR